ncbi:MAG: hypothetical protein V4739_19175 [Pseudomonadota bacterium]
MNHAVHDILPTFVKITLVTSLLAVQLDVGFVGITFTALVGCIVFTVGVTEGHTENPDVVGG